MELGRQRRSTNIEDRRNAGGRSAGGMPLRVGGLGIGGVVAVGLLLFFFPQARPLVLGLLGEPAQERPMDFGAPGDSTGDFVAAVLGSVEDVWAEQFRQERLARFGISGPYQPATLVLFADSTQSACGFAQSATGPFYCPPDQRIYLDTSFFEALEQRLGAGGDFAQAYVVAHEVGHHIQNLAGISAAAFEARQNLPPAQANAISVRVELMADCFAGVWGHHADQIGQLSDGDLQEAIVAAEAIGDDRLQRQSQGTVVPDSFTHGTSEQRARWFRIGFETGDPAQCDTRQANPL